MGSRQVSHLHAIRRHGDISTMGFVYSNLCLQAGDPQAILPELFNLPELSSAPKEVIEAVERFLSLPEEQKELEVSSKH